MRMAIFRDIERRLENLVEGFFNHRFSSAIQPIELARKLAAETDRKRQVSVARTYAPNVFMIHLSQADFEAVDGFRDALTAELGSYVKAHARDRGYRFSGSVHISIAPEPDLQPGECTIHSHIEEFGGAAGIVDGGTQIISARELSEALKPGKSAVLSETDTGATYSLRRRTVTLGRKSDNDIVIADPGASRYHARVEMDGDEFYLVDLESTNGTLHNGRPCERVRLSEDDTVTIGRAEFIFGHETSD